MSWTDSAVALALPVLQSEGGDDPFPILAIGFIGGLVAIYWGWTRYRRYTLIRDTPTARVRSMAVGRTELEGTGRVAETAISAPFTDDPCLFTSWRIEEYQYDHDDNEHEWVTIGSGRDAVDFYLEDDTGRVLVRAGSHEVDFDLSDQHQRTISVGGSERPPPAVREFLANKRSDWDLGDFMDDPVAALGDVVKGGGFGSTGSTSNKRRYIQTVLPVDHHVYLFGNAQPRPVAEASDRRMGANEDLLEMVPDDATGLFLISDRKEGTLTEHYSRIAPVAMFGGLAVSAVSLYFLLSWYILV